MVWPCYAAATGDPGADQLGAGFQRGAVDDQAGGDGGDHLGLHQAVGFQGGAGLHQIDDQPREAEAGGEFHGARQFHHLGLHAAGGEVAAGDGGVFARHPHAGPAGGIVRPGGGQRFRHRDAAAADAEIERGVDFRVVEFHQHVGPADPERGGAEGDEGGDVERADPDHIKAGFVGGKAQPAAGLVGVVRGRGDARARQQRAAFGENAALG